MVLAVSLRKSEIGVKIVTLQSDGETTVQTICKLAAERFTFENQAKAISTNTRITSPYSSNSNGSVERAIRLIRDQLRVMFGCIAHKFNVVFDPKTKSMVGTSCLLDNI